jgi:hypothetical protein
MHWPLQGWADRSHRPSLVNHEVAARPNKGTQNTLLCARDYDRSFGIVYIWNKCILIVFMVTANSNTLLSHSFSWNVFNFLLIYFEHNHAHAFFPTSSIFLGQIFRSQINDTKGVNLDWTEGRGPSGQGGSSQCPEAQWKWTVGWPDQLTPMWNAQEGQGITQSQVTPWGHRLRLEVSYKGL